MKNKSGSDGIIALETLISLTFFMFFMYFVFSYIVLFMGHNMIEHALVETGDSLALESYGIYKLNDGKMQVSDLARHVVQKITDSPTNEVTGEADFYTHTRWFEGAKSDVNFNHAIGDQSVIERRFKAYLGGSTEKADQILKAFRITNLDFSESTFNSQELELALKYDIELMFRVSFGKAELGKFHSKQKATFKLWGKRTLESWRIEPEKDEE